jgi:hypothetical protein
MEESTDSLILADGDGVHTTVTSGLKSLNRLVGGAVCYSLHCLCRMK